MRYDKKVIYLAIIVFSIAIIATNMKGAYNYEYVNVTSRVNVTNAYPWIDSMRLDQGGAQGISLNAGSIKQIYCNVSVHDWNGYGDIIKINATLWDNNTVNTTTADDNSTHYTNTNCTFISSSGLYYANYSCNFSVWYYANNGSNWYCNATAMDSWNFTNSMANKTTIAGFYALNLTPLVDYGNLVLGQTSANMTANVTNFGNLPINLSVLGYGGTNPITGANYSMICQFGNITIGNQRFATNNTADWGAKTILSSSSQNMTGLTSPKRTAGMLWNTTYWQLYVDPTNDPFGVCNGTLEFTASAG